jgi:acetyl-CoA decarbonylase/synthase, CODH/ACS complex subunit delta
LGFEFYKESYAGGIKEITLGKGDKAVTVGGETCYPFYQFEGEMPNKPRIAMEIWDSEPDEWPEASLIPFKDVLSDPVAWAKKCVDEFAAEMIVLQLKSTDPNGTDASPEAAAEIVKKVAGAVDVPLIVWGTNNVEKDEAVLKKVAEVCEGENLVIGPVEDKNHKGIGASAMGYGHAVISSSPIDVNLAKQVNILLENLGVSMDNVIVDPTTGGLGYGMEYTYSVMERLRMAALAQGDDKLQLPIINNLGNEVWKCKEAKQSVEEAPALGDPERRGILMEAVGAIGYLVSGSDILIMRHPEAIRLVKSFIDLAMDGGSAADVAPIAKQLDDVDIDFAAISPDPDLTIPQEKKAAAAKKAAPAKEAAPKKEAPKKAAPPKAIPEEEAPKVAEAKPEVDEVAVAEADAAAKVKAEAEAKVQAAAEAKAKAEAEAKAKAEGEAKAKAEADAKAKADEDAKAKEISDREVAEEALRQKRLADRESHEAKAGVEVKATEGVVTAAAVQKTETEKILDKLNWVHRRIPLY